MRSRDRRSAAQRAKAGKPARAARERAPVDDVMALQRTIGNTATRTALARQDEGSDGGAQTEAAPRDREVQRLEDEMLKRARRNAWKGVAGSYRAIEERGYELARPQFHALAAKAEMELVGATERYEELLQRGVDADDAEAKAAMDVLRADYQKVRIRAGGFLGGIFKGRPTLARAMMPFAPDQRRTVEHAVSVLEGSKRLDGFLPVGEYTLNEEPFEITGGSGVRELRY